MSTLESGWYDNNKRVGPMKEDNRYKMFTINDIFLDPYNIGQFKEIIDTELPPDAITC